MEVLWTACKGIMIGVGLIAAIKLFGWDITDDLTESENNNDDG